MKLDELKRLLSQRGITPSRKLGQNFLIDPNAQQGLVEDIAPTADEHIVEIGPGLGALTTALLDRSARLTAIEYDRRLAAYLEETIAAQPRIELHCADAVRFDYDELTQTQPWRCVGNLPYAASSVIVARLLDLDNPPRRCDFLLQDEMAARIAADAGSKTYGVLSVRAQLLYHVERGRQLPPDVFWPRPQVRSACLRLALRPERPPVDVLNICSRLVRRGFSQRRKKLIKLLRRDWPELNLRRLLDAHQLDPAVRAEDLAPTQFLRLAEDVHRATRAQT